MHMNAVVACILGVTFLNASGWTIKRCGRDLKTGDFCMVPYCNGTCYNDVCLCPWEKKPFSLHAGVVNASTESSTAHWPSTPRRPSSPPTEMLPITSPQPVTFISTTQPLETQTSRLPDSTSVETTTQKMTTKFQRKRKHHHCKCHGKVITKKEPGFLFQNI
ncbi:uncharacterized protein LOC125946538 [Dermacentor silvarum]|uniref:uncharacterized protein LOC125946538 n=1 Tax=Dermacentor silvarum TaxID=543639 RepID=UPI002100AC7F|nr:uncharacterized protein LOC125946538 [Dermacentor silvarum]